MSGAYLHSVLRCHHCCVSATRRLQCRKTGWQASGTRAFASLHVNKRMDARFDHASAAWTALAVGLVVSGGLASGDLPQTGSTTACEPRQPRNVMLHSMRSVRGRGLHDKYNVDWKIVVGEGAYGSVHPARLAATGEKVTSLMMRYRILTRSR
jgi:hypothetical protein